MEDKEIWRNRLNNPTSEELFNVKPSPHSVRLKKIDKVLNVSPQEIVLLKKQVQKMQEQIVELQKELKIFVYRSRRLETRVNAQVQPVVYENKKK
jgi:hypothetical protein